MPEKRIVQKINSALSFVPDENGKPIQWFYCFGTLLEFIRSRGQVFDLTHDIDVGVLYSEANAESIVKVFEGMGYDKRDVLINDVTKKPLNIHFAANDHTPDIDLFFWVEIGGLLYHTYDYYKERNKIPSKYRFKGVPKRLIMPKKETIAEERKSHREGDRLLTEKGVWVYSIFGDHSGYEFRCPFSYGTLLDIWYPGWMIEQKHYGQSKSENIIEVTSCKKL